MTNKSDHIRIFLTIYAVFFTLGMRDSIEAAWAVKDNKCQIWISAMILALIGLRLIFSIEPFNQLLILFHNKSERSLPRYLVAFYPLLLIQAACVFLACHALMGCAKDAELARSIFFFALAALVVNVVFLFLIVAVEKYEKLHGSAPEDITRARRTWLANNVMTILIATPIVSNATHFAVISGLFVFLFGSIIDLAATGEWYLPRIGPQERCKYTPLV